VPVDEPEDEDVAVGEVEGENRRRALKTRKAGGIHPGRIPETALAAEASWFAVENKIYYGHRRSQTYIVIC